MEALRGCSGVTVGDSFWVNCCKPRHGRDGASSAQTPKRWLVRRALTLTFSVIVSRRALSTRGTLSLRRKSTTIPSHDKHSSTHATMLSKITTALTPLVSSRPTLATASHLRLFR